MGKVENTADTRGQADRARQWRRWTHVLVVVSAASIALAACGDSSSDGTMVLGMTLTPNPTTAVPSEAEGYDFIAPYLVTLRETGGLGGAITDVDINVYEAVDGEPGDLAVVSDNLLLDYETSRLEPRGTLELQFNTFYSLANEGKAAIIDVFIFMIDDDGFTTQVGDRLIVQ